MPVFDGADIRLMRFCCLANPVEIQLLSNSEQEPEITSANSGRARTWSVGALVVEVTSIVVGVLLALALSEWSDERNHQIQAELALVNVAGEIRSNHKMLAIIHVNNIETIRAMGDDPETGEDRDFIPGLQLRETAWEAFLTTGLSNYASYDKVLSLSQMYAIQNIYKQTGLQLVQSTMTMSAYASVLEKDVDNHQFQKQFGAYFELLSAIESQLLLSYESSLAEFDDQ